MMDVLRRESLKEGFEGPLGKIPKFHKVFVEQIRKRGRIDEARLLINYELKTRDFLPLEKFREEPTWAWRCTAKASSNFPR
jgi:hypothetical protein